ncbi:MAG TPA: hypothetical protein VHL11_25765 [Phototrophicaceae bacterium]|nr:hypothetical protein [Phototrophicaceae bacterium]
MATSEQEKIWENYVEAAKSFDRSIKEVLKLVGDARVEFIRRSLRESKSYQAWQIIKVMPAQEVQKLPGELLSYAAYAAGGYVHVSQEIILGLPREWVLANIEQYASPILENDDYIDYVGLLDLYEKLDRDLMLCLVQQGLTMNDADIRAEAAEVLKKLQD